MSKMPSPQTFSFLSAHRRTRSQHLDSVFANLVLTVLALSLSVVCIASAAQTVGANKAAHTDNELAEKPASTLAEKLAGRVDLIMSNMDVQSAIQHISEITGVNMVVDQRALNEIRRQGNMANVDIRLKDVPLKQAMAVILRGAGLGFAVYDYFIFISTPTRVRHESLDPLETRVYSLKSAGSQSLPKVLVLDPSSGTRSIATPALPIPNQR